MIDNFGPIGSCKRCGAHITGAPFVKRGDPAQYCSRQCCDGKS
jgi:hypothetical protein